MPGTRWSLTARGSKLILSKAGQGQQADLG
jgi:hypothetical protein